MVVVFINARQNCELVNHLAKKGKLLNRGKYMSCTKNDNIAACF